MKKILTNRSGQHLMEFLVMFLALSVAFVGMRLYLRRGVNAKLKLVEGQLNASMKGAGSTGLVYCHAYTYRSGCRHNRTGDCANDGVTRYLLKETALYLSNSQQSALQSGSLEMSVIDFNKMTGLSFAAGSYTFYFRTGGCSINCANAASTTCSSTTLVLN